MSDLPDDMAEWPRDPFALFDLPRTASIRDIRLAYTRAIKRFKPEQRPREFQRLREAYELLRRMVEPQSLHEYATADELEPPKPVVATTAPVVREDEFDRLWSLACEGDPASAYRRLREIESADPGCPEACVRLYWLREVFPDVEPGRRAASWLTAGLGRTGLRGRLWTLFLQQLREDRVASTEPVDEAVVLAAGGASPLIDYVCEKWRSAARVLGFHLALHQLIRRDVEILESHGRFLFPADAATLHLVAADFLAWDAHAPGFEIVETCRSEAGNLPANDRRMDLYCDRFDELMRLSADWRDFKFAPRGWMEFLKAVPALWNARLADSQALLLKVWQPVVRDPGDSVQGMLVLQGSAPRLAAHLCGLVEEAAQIWEVPIFSVGARQAAERFLASASRRPGLFRRKLVEFCTAAWVPPNEVVEAGLSRDDGRFDHLRAPLEESSADPAASTVWRIYSMFWSAFAPAEVLEAALAVDSQTWKPHSLA